MDFRDRLSLCTGFEWDEGNLHKNWETHRVAFWEAEEIFLTGSAVLLAESQSDRVEERFYALGGTESGRHLFLVFTIRGRHIRVISARDMSRKERAIFDAKQKENSREEDTEI